jgi:hypothetical protein
MTLFWNNLHHVRSKSKDRKVLGAIKPKGNTGTFLNNYWHSNGRDVCNLACLFCSFTCFMSPHKLSDVFQVQNNRKWKFAAQYVYRYDLFYITNIKYNFVLNFLFINLRRHVNRHSFISFHLDAIFLSHSASLNKTHYFCLLHDPNCLSWLNCQQQLRNHVHVIFF